MLPSDPTSIHAYTHRRAVNSVPSALYVRPISLRPASFNPSLRNESLPSRYPSCYLSRGWTCPLEPTIVEMLRLTQISTLVRSRSAPASSRASPAHNQAVHRIAEGRAALAFVKR